MKRQSIQYQRTMHEIEMQRFLARFICHWLSVSCSAALVLFCLQGFHLWGFFLDKEIVRLIMVATVGGIGSLAAAVYSAFFRGSPLFRKQRPVRHPQT